MAKVLIVEDDPRTSTMVAALLDARGYDTRVESNGAAALLAAHEDLPDLIVIDLQVPILEGQETIHALRADPRTAHIPVIVLSNRDDDRTLADALVAGANIYLVTPPEPHGLTTVVGRLAAMQPEDATSQL